MKPILPKTSGACMSMPQIRNVLTQPGTTIILTSLPGSQNIQQPNTSVLLPSASTIMLGGAVGQQPASLILPLKTTKSASTTGTNRHHQPLLAPKCVLPKVESVRPVSKKALAQVEEVKVCKVKEGGLNELPRGSHQGSTIKSILPKVAPADAHTLILLPARTPEILPSTFSAVVPSKITLGSDLSHNRLNHQEGTHKSTKKKKDRRKKVISPLQQEKEAVANGKTVNAIEPKRFAKKNSGDKDIRKSVTKKLFTSFDDSKTFTFEENKSEEYSGVCTSSSSSSDYLASTQSSFFPKQNLVHFPPPPYPKSPRNRSTDLVLQEVESGVKDWCSKLESQNSSHFSPQFDEGSCASVKCSSETPIYAIDDVSELKSCSTTMSSHVFSSASSKSLPCFSQPTAPVYAAPITSQPRVIFSTTQHDSLPHHTSSSYSTIKTNQSSSPILLDNNRLAASCQSAPISYSVSSSLSQLSAPHIHSIPTSISHINSSHSDSSSHYTSLPETSSSPLAIQKDSTSCFSFPSTYEGLSQSNQTEHQPLHTITPTTVESVCNQVPDQSVYSYTSKSAAFRECPQPFSEAVSSPFYTESQQSLQAEQYMHSPHQASYIQSPQPGSFSRSSHAVSYSQSPQSVSYIPSPHAALYNEGSQSNIYNDPPQSAAYDQPKFFLRSENIDSYAQSPQAFANTISHESPLNNGHESPQPASYPAGQISNYSQSPQQPAYCNSPQSTPTPVQSSSGISQTPLLPAYSFSEHTSHYLNSSSPVNSSIYDSHHTNLAPDPQVCENKGILTSAPYSTGNDECSGIERAQNPPSYEAHFQNSTAYTHPSHHESDMSQHMAIPPLQTDLPSYPMPCHSPRFIEQGLASINVDPRSCVKSPPAYPSSPSLPLPPPSYSSNSHLMPSVHNSPYPVNSVQGSPYPVTSAQESSYPVACNINSALNDYSSLAGPNNFFPNNPPAVPPPAAPPPLDNQSCLAHTSHADGFPGAMPSSSFPSALYLPPGESLQDFENEEVILKSQSRNIKSAAHQPEYKHYNQESSTSELKNLKRSGASGTDTSQVHNIIERAERLWFIPHQEQNRAYIKRKELARDFLNSSHLQSNRDTLLKEKFWIEEDEPIAEEIVMSATIGEQAKNNEAFASTSTNPYQRNQSQDVKNKKKQNKELLCQVCGKMLKGRSSLKSHLNSHRSIQPHSCMYCPKSFTNRSILVAHLRIHTGEMPYVCSVCDRAFRTQSRLHRHKSMHSNERNHKCSVCSKAFKTKLVLQQHLKLHLTGLFTCSDCGKTFERHRSLAVHKASHYHNSQRFPCPHCPKSYHFQSLLKNHMQVHSDVQKHVCSICSKAFVWRSGLAAHMKSHSTSRPQCEVCGMRFASKKRLETHTQKHGNPKPHHCDVCGRSFSHAYRLASHKLVHEEHTDYTCPKCGVVCTSGKKLRKHLAEHKKEEPRICPLSGTVEITKSG